MAVSMSIVVFLGVISALLIRSRQVQIMPSLVIFLLGFYVAGTGAFDTINNTVTTLVHLVH